MMEGAHNGWEAQATATALRNKATKHKKTQREAEEARLKALAEKERDKVEIEDFSDEDLEKELASTARELINEKNTKKEEVVKDEAKEADVTPVRYEEKAAGNVTSETEAMAVNEQGPVEGRKVIVETVSAEEIVRGKPEVKTVDVREAEPEKEPEVKVYTISKATTVDSERDAKEAYDGRQNEEPVVKTEDEIHDVTEGENTALDMKRSTFTDLIGKMNAILQELQTRLASAYGEVDQAKAVLDEARAVFDKKKQTAADLKIEIDRVMQEYSQCIDKAVKNNNWD